MAIAKTYILQNLSTLEHRFNHARSQKILLLYSKVAVLELCGWIEMTMDEIVLGLARRKLKDVDNLKRVDAETKRNHGFDYDNNYRKLLCYCIGIVTVEKIEQKADITKFVKLKAELKNLKQSRDALAHTYVKGFTHQIDAPSITRSRFIHLYDGLKDLERAIATTLR